MKKIIHITNDLHRLGGVQRLLVDLITLQKDEFRFEVILTRGENEYKQEFEKINIPVYKLEDLGFLGVINQLNSADLVHSHLFPSMYIALLSSTLKVLTEHNPNYKRRSLPFVRVLESILFRRFICVVCISKGVKVSFSKAIKLKKNRVVIINNGVDVTRFSMKEKKIINTKSLFKICMVGRLVPAKDITTLIKCINELGPKYELHLAGDGELRNQLQSLVSSLKLDQQIFFHGQVNDIPDFLSSMDLYIQSSNWEGFGLAAVEAMAMGLPCFATNVDGLNQVVDFDCLFEVGDVNQLVHMVKHITSDTDLYHRISKRAVVLARKFSIENTAKNHTELYQRILKKIIL